MYSTCLFCNNNLGRNEAVEHFPLGRRLAFDEAKGRLWVVCKSCERWNLTPLEERWEAIEECEKLFRGTKRRISTDQIGLAKLREGLELVRIGQPLRPEMAAWRYGDQFGRRRERNLIVGAVGIALFASSSAIFALMGLAAARPITNAYLLGHGLRAARRRIAIALPNGGTALVALKHVDQVSMFGDGHDVILRVPVLTSPDASRFRVAYGGTKEIDFRGEQAIHAAGALLPTLNARGASKRQVRNAVEFIEQADDPRTLFRGAVQAMERDHKGNVLKRLPNEGRIALEMVANEETERRAMEGELHILEEMWKSAEEVAGIADEMFLSDALTEKFDRLKSGE